MIEKVSFIYSKDGISSIPLAEIEITDRRLCKGNTKKQMSAKNTTLIQATRAAEHRVIATKALMLSSPQCPYTSTKFAQPLVQDLTDKKLLVLAVADQFRVLFRSSSGEDREDYYPNITE
ncbi:hypothetical protein Ciccas_010138 [Cichlidogyrus casuarinus]|uniref:Uncharacterized protein n=1 Tax=Cichlidogyrus casuarinus TaxID=1844966 RepID=A0ABD2PUZ1_9PLAT